MLSAKRQSDGATVLAYFEKNANGPFLCLECNEEVILKSGRKKVDHFAHAVPLLCQRTSGESDNHRRCKIEIFHALLQEDCVEDVMLERDLGSVRPDIFARIRGVPVAIEIQISNLSVEAIMQRTIWYHRKGIYVLWLLLWSPKLNQARYSPKPWEKWIHACYFGRVYYWTRGLDVLSYSFIPSIRASRRRIWFDRSGKRRVSGGDLEESKRGRIPVRGNISNLARDFWPRQRLWWEGGGIKVPDAKLFMDQTHTICDKHRK